MTKSEFMRFIQKEAADEKSVMYTELARLVELVLKEYPDTIEIDTDKKMSDVVGEMEKYAKANASGRCGCCPPGEAERICRSVFGLDKAENVRRGEPSAAAEMDILDLLG